MTTDTRKRGVPKPVRILIADDHPRSRRGLRALLSTSSEIEVVGEATNGQEAVHLTETYQPDAVLMDARMPLMDGVQAAELIKNRWPHVKVLILTLSKLALPGSALCHVDAILVKGCPVAKIWTAILDSD